VIAVFLVVPLLAIIGVMSLMLVGMTILVAVLWGAAGDEQENEREVQ
jgi:hypothetical protein